MRKDIKKDKNNVEFDPRLRLASKQQFDFIVKREEVVEKIFLDEHFEMIAEIETAITSYLLNDNGIHDRDKIFLAQILKKIKTDVDLTLYDLHTIALAIKKEIHLTIGGEREALKWKK